MTAQPILLKSLLLERHWQTYRTFCHEYDKAARKVDATLVGSWPSRAQLHRWLSGGLKGLPYPDHCRVLEKMFPGTSAERLFEPASALDQQPAPQPEDAWPIINGERDQGIELITSGGDLVAALIRVVKTAQECLVAVGSRSREPSYLHEIEIALKSNPDLVHYRILIGPPHSQVLEDHLLNLVELHNARPNQTSRRTVHIGVRFDPIHDYERFFVASEQLAVAVLPSVNSPTNFDTGVLFHNTTYARGLLQHGKALYGRQRLETAESISELEVLQ